jgi:GDP-mannose 6-dehydrogenase
VKITIFGMGYVGVVSAACLLRDGHEVTGVDPIASKVDELAQGRTPVQEPGVAQLLAAGHAAGRLRATSEPAAGLGGCEMVWVSVGTPSRADGSINLAAVETAAKQIGDYLKTASKLPLLVLRSTVVPGTSRRVVVPAVERASGLICGRDFHVVFHPEFLREGSAVEDFDQPPKIVAGEDSPGAADPLFGLYGRYDAPRFRLRLEEAELVKYCDNLFHAVKITFANEVGAMARAVGVDGRRIADVFCSDTKLNISPRYLRPGFAFGGSCLPKDLRAFLREAELRSIRVPMLGSVLESNAQQIEELIARILGHRPRTVGMVGLAFKPGVDDMRESPYVTVAKRLLGEGKSLRIHDPGVHPDRLIGANKTLVQSALGHLEQLLVSDSKQLDACDLVIINHATVSAAQVNEWLRRGIRVVDMAGIAGVDRAAGGYEGIAW